MEHPEPIDGIGPAAMGDTPELVAVGLLSVAAAVVVGSLVVTFAAGWVGMVAYVLGQQTRQRRARRIGMKALAIALVVGLVPFVVYEVSSGLAMELRLGLMALAVMVAGMGLQVVMKRREPTPGSGVMGLGPEAEGRDPQNWARAGT